MLQVATKTLPAKQHYRSKHEWIFLVAILLAGLATFLPSLGVTGIIDPSDGFFSESSREMYESGNYIVPRLNYEAYNNKPILTNWLICASYKLFGVSEYSSRVPSALCAVALCLVTYLFARKFLPRRTAALSSLILLSSILFSSLARVSLTDMPLACFICSALFALFSAVEQKNKRMMFIGHVCLALSFFTKGPIAYLIAGGTFLLYFLATMPRFSVGALVGQFKKLDVFRMLAITAVVNLPWFIAVGIATHGGFITDFFFTENVMRAMGKIQMNHAQPPYYYVQVFFAGFFPWVVPLLIGVPVLRKWWQRRCVSSPRIRLLVFCAATFLTVFGGFSVLKGKLPTYILPLFPAVSIVTATLLDTFVRAGRGRLLIWMVPVLVAAGVGCLLPFPLKQEMIPGFQLCITLFGVASLTSFVSFAALIWAKKPRQAVGYLAVCWSLIAAMLVPFMFKVFYNYHQRAYAALLEEATTKNELLIEIVNESPSAPFYLRKHVPSIQNYWDFAYLMDLTPGEKLILCQNSYEQLAKRAPECRLIGRRGQYALYAVSDPKQILVQNYLAKRRAAELAHQKDPDVPGAEKITITPTRSIFLPQ